MSKYTIRFMPDYSGTSLWPYSDNSYSDLGIPIEYRSLGLSDSLIQSLEAFDDSIMDILDWNDPGKGIIVSNETLKQMYLKGQRLYKMVKEELGPDFTVIEKLDLIKPTPEIR